MIVMINFDLYRAIPRTKILAASNVKNFTRGYIWTDSLKKPNVFSKKIFNKFFDAI